VKLDVGSGKASVEGYRHLDNVPYPHIDYVCDAASTPIGDGEVSEIRSRHFLEHLDRDHVRRVLAEWRRILKPGGAVHVWAPDIIYHGAQLSLPGKSQYLPHKTNFEHAMAGLYGWPTETPNMVHKWGYTPKTLQILFVSAGFRNVELPTPERACDIELTAINP